MTARRTLALALAAAVSLTAASSASALRSATAQERRAMIQAVENDAATYYPERGLHNDGCAGRFYITKVSTVNRTYARLSLNNRKRSARGCLVGDGYKVLRRQGGIWTPLMDGSWDVAMCTRLGRAVALDLTRDARLTCD